MKKRILLSSILTIAICLSLIAGSTYALFTSESGVNIAVNSGKVNVIATIDNLETYSIGVLQPAGTFENGGTASLVDGQVTLTNITPGDKATLDITVENNSNVDILYRIKYVVKGELAALGGFKATADNVALVTSTSEWTEWSIPASDNDKVKVIPVSIELPVEAGNEYQDKVADIFFTVEAVQGNGTWDGSADSTWFDATATSFELDDAAKLAGLISLVNDNGETFEGKTITLTNDIVLYGSEWTPIGDGSTQFKGTFDGNDKVITGLTFTGATTLSQVGLFGDLGEGATIKNLTLAEVDIDTVANYAAAVAGSADADGITFENVKVISGSVTAKSYAAGIVFEVSGSNVTIKNCENYANITATSMGAGGIAAWIDNSTTKVESCVNYGSIVGGNRAAGISGNFAGEMTSCVNYGDVVSNGSMPAGGMVAVASNTTTFNYCVNNGDVKTVSTGPNASAAGILGQTPSKASTFNYCVNNGDITAEGSYAAGIAYGLYGNMTANYCYNSGAITGSVAGGISPKPQYGTSSKAVACLNSGAVTSAGVVYPLANQNTDAFYYDGTDLKSATGAVIAPADALVILNGGSDSSFFDLVDGKIVPAN